MKKTVVILGPTGLLGSAIYSVLKDKCRLILAARDQKAIPLLYERYGHSDDVKVVEFDAALLYQSFFAKKEGTSEHSKKFLSDTDGADYVINAVGVVGAGAEENPALTFFINGALPHILANVFGENLIQIATDGVYDGRNGFPYSERSPKSPVDLYGLSKSLGEPVECLMLRTSVIGRELSGAQSLLEWFLSQKGKAITGFADHFWNGITAREFGKICEKIISNPEAYPKTGLYHIFSDTLSKYDMLLKFREKYQIDCDIKPDHGNKINRTLATVYGFNAELKIPSFDAMLKEL